MSIGIIVQARIGSTRLPNKVLMPLANDKTVLDYVLTRVKMSERTGAVILATTDLPRDDGVGALAQKHNVKIFRGSESDVLGRYIGAMRANELNAAVRITADCPLIEPQVIDNVIELYHAQPSDYVFIEGYPRGTGDAELVTLDALEDAGERAGDMKYYREHVITYLLDHPQEFKLTLARAPEKYRRDVRICVDEAADLEMIRRICEHFAPRMDFHLDEIVEYLDAHPEIAAINQHVQQKVL
jgi:spore coat polysaccharide biosynthesis protein SpsF